MFECIYITVIFSVFVEKNYLFKEREIYVCMYCGFSSGPSAYLKIQGLLNSLVPLCYRLFELTFYFEQIQDYEELQE